MANDLIKVPEFLIFDTLKNILKYIKDDYTEAVNKNDSFLLQIIHDLGLQRYKYDKQAIAVFVKESDDPRALTVEMMLNMKKIGPPTIHVTVPSDSNAQNAIGGSQNSFQDIVYYEGTKEYRNTFSRRLRTTLSLVITSDNSNEVVLIYHIVRALLISLQNHLALLGLENLTFGGQDLSLMSDKIPPNMYFRALNLGIEYQTSSLDLSKQRYFIDILADGALKDLEEDE